MKENIEEKNNLKIDEDIINNSLELNEDIDEQYTPDILRMYMNEVSKYPLLTLEEEKKYGEDIKKINNLKIAKVDDDNFHYLDVNTIFYNLIDNNDSTSIINKLNDIYILDKNKFTKAKLKKFFDIYNKNNKSLNQDELKEYFKISNCNIIGNSDLNKELDDYIQFVIARDKLINSNLRLVISIAKKYSNKTVIDFIELINEGNIGLMIATEKFDVDLGNKFVTYATWWVYQRITRYILMNSTQLKVSENFLRDSYKFNKKVEEMQKENKKNYSIEELMKIFNLDYETAQKYLCYNGVPVSLEKSINDEEDSSLVDVIEDKNFNINNEIDKSILYEEMQFLFDDLTKMEKEVIMLRFGINTSNKRSLTLREIANIYHVSASRIRQVEANAFRKLRRKTFTDPKAKDLRLYIK